MSDLEPSPGAPAPKTTHFANIALHANLLAKSQRMSPEMAEAVWSEVNPTLGEPARTVARRLQKSLARFGVPIRMKAALRFATDLQIGDRTTPARIETPGDRYGGFARAKGLLAVERPEVDEVLDRATGAYERHTDVIGDDWAQALQLRMQVQETLDTNPRFLCAHCMTPVYIVARKDKKLFFRHTLEDGRCSAVTRGLLSQDEIDARRYNGIKESWLHIEMKRWVEACLRADGRFEDIKVESRWAGAITGEWRKPDVRAAFNGIKVAFEIQLSTTYINVIAQRREFYRREGGLLFWVFSHFNLGPRRLTQDDVFFNNNRNAFVVSEQTCKASLESKRFLLDAIWAQPLEGGLVGPLERRTVGFDELTFDQARQRAFYVDVDGEAARIAEQSRLHREQELAQLRTAFEEFYEPWAQREGFDQDRWEELCDRFLAYGLELPLHPGFLPKSLLNALFSAKYGRVYGWRFPNFIQVAHHVEQSLKPQLHYFRRALKCHDRADLIRREDPKRLWRAKVKGYLARIAADDPKYAPDHEHDELVWALFPEIMTVTLEDQEGMRA